MNDRRTVTPAEAWRLAQAAEYRVAQREGRDVPLDDDGKVVPSRAALDQVEREYRVSDPTAESN